MADTPSPSFIQNLVAMGGFGALTGFLTWVTTRAKHKAEARKTDAETRKTDAETVGINENRGIELQRVLDEKAVNIIAALERQVGYLTRVVEGQNARIAEMERTIEGLRADLHEAKYGEVPVKPPETPFNVI